MKRYKVEHLELITSKIHQLLFRHTFETQIHIQTQIRKTILVLATNDFLQVLLKYHKELPTTKLLTEK